MWLTVFVTSNGNDTIALIKGTGGRALAPHSTEYQLRLLDRHAAFHLLSGQSFMRAGARVVLLKMSLMQIIVTSRLDGP